jgi:DNA-directed RNA polymerase specialized sigma subunit
VTEASKTGGMLTAAELNKVLKAFPRMSDEGRSIAHCYFVDGHSAVDAAAQLGVSEEQVRFVCAEIFEAHLKLTSGAQGRSK